MPIPTSGSVGTEVPSGVQTEFRITDSTFDQDNKYGPSFELDLELAEEQYLGVSMRYWAKIQQPRLDLVRNLRGQGLDDETIESALRKQGFEFDSIDDPDELKVARGGNLYKILTAVEGSAKGAEAVLRRCNSFDELAECLIDGSFIGTTKRSADGKYVKLDGKEEIYLVASKLSSAKAEAESANDAEIDELGSDDDPPAPF